MSRHGSDIAVYREARGVPEIQAHVFRFNGKHYEGAGVSSIGSSEQYQCQLFDGGFRMSALWDVRLRSGPSCPK